MKILFYSTSMLDPHQFSTELDIALDHINNNDEVHFLVCESSLISCEKNMLMQKQLCSSCMLIRNNGLNIINLPKENIHEISLGKFVEEVNFPEFNSMDELKEYYIDGIDIGSTVASTIITYFNETKLDTTRQNTYIKKMLKNSLAVYKAVTYYLKEIKPDLFYIFNGRTTSRRPAFRAAQKLKIETFVHENSNNKGYDLFKNATPHSLEYVKQEIELKWLDNMNLSEKIKIAESLFINKRNGEDIYGLNYIEKQEKNRLPADFDHKKRNITIYNSTEAEMDSVDGWKETIYKNQYEGICLLLDSVKEPDIHFYLRIHPNLANFNSSQISQLYSLNFPNLTIIPPDSEIDSYALLQNSEKVITFGSTMGIEAAFWGKVSILAARAFYEDLGACYFPKTHQEVIDLLIQPIAALPKLGALKFSYWQQAHSYSYKFFTDFSKLYDGIIYGVKKNLIKIPELSFQKNVLTSIEVKQLPELQYKVNLLNFFKNMAGKNSLINKVQTKIEEKIEDLEKEIEVLRSNLNSKISFCILSRNNEKYIEQCLENIISVAFEIIILDLGSTDRTKEIAGKYGKVFEMVWEENFSKARNKCIEYTKGEWIFFVEPDELLKKNSQEKIISITSQYKENASPAIINVKVRQTDNDKTFYRKTLFKTNQNIHYVKPVFEHLNFYPDKLITINCDNIELFKIRDAVLDFDYYSLLKNIFISKREPDIYYYYFYQGELYYQSKQYPEALDSYKKSFQDFNDNEFNKVFDEFPVIYANTLIRIIEILCETNLIKDSFYFIEKLFALIPEYPQTLAFLGLYYQSLDDLNKAIEAYDKFLLFPSDYKYEGLISFGKEFLSFIKYNLSDCYFRKGNGEKGIMHLIEAYNAIHDDNPLIYKIIEYYLTNNNLAGAINFYLSKKTAGSNSKQINIKAKRDLINILVNLKKQHKWPDKYLKILNDSIIDLTLGLGLKVI